MPDDQPTSHEIMLEYLTTAQQAGADRDTVAKHLAVVAHMVAEHGYGQTIDELQQKDTDA